MSKKSLPNSTTDLPKSENLIKVNCLSAVTVEAAAEPIVPIGPGNPPNTSKKLPAPCLAPANESCISSIRAWTFVNSSVPAGISLNSFFNLRSSPTDASVSTFTLKSISLAICKFVLFY